MKQKTDDDDDATDTNVATILEKTSTKSGKKETTQGLPDPENDSVKSDEAFGSAAELGSETDRRSVNAVQKSSDHSGVKKGDRKEKHVSSQT